MFRLETDRLIIRPWNPDDRPAFTALTRDPEVMHYVHRGLPYSEDEVDEWFTRQARQLAEHDLCMGAVIEKSSGRFIGLAGTQPLGTTGELEIGWILARDAWGHGYATEAGSAAMRHVLETLARPRVVAIIDPDNEPSKRVAARLGMKYEARYSGTQLGHRNPEIVVDLFFRLRRWGMQTMMRTTLLSSLLLASCASPRIIEFTARPELVCPCDPVTVRIVAENTRRDTLTFDPPSTPAVVGDWSSDAPHVFERAFPVCDSTNLTYVAHRDGATDVTQSQRVEVVHGDYVEPIRFVAACEGGVFRGFQPVDTSPIRFSPSLVVRRVTNNSHRAVRLSHNGGTLVAAGPGEDYPGFVGVQFGDRWTAAADLIVAPDSRESCVGGPGLPVDPMPRPGIINVPIPPLDVTFIIGCPPH